MTSEFERELLKAKFGHDEAVRIALELRLQAQRQREEEIKQQEEHLRNAESEEKQKAWRQFFNQHILPVKPVIEPLMLDLARATWVGFNASFDIQVETNREWLDTNKPLVRGNWAGAREFKYSEIFYTLSPNLEVVPDDFVPRLQEYGVPWVVGCRRNVRSDNARMEIRNGFPVHIGFEGSHRYHEVLLDVGKGRKSFVSRDWHEPDIEKNSQSLFNLYYKRYKGGRTIDIGDQQLKELLTKLFINGPRVPDDPRSFHSSGSGDLRGHG